LLPGNEVRIASDSGALLADGHVGEIHIRSDTLFTGYYNRPDLTAAALVDGWYRTGDLGFCREGELYVVGRKKDLLIVGGENLYPQDIEELVARHPAVHDGRVVAMGVYNPDLGTEDIIVVAEVAGEELLAHVTEIEREVRSLVVEGLGVAVRSVFLKPPKWIVKSTAGKAARSTTREKLLQEHPELNVESGENTLV
jgi:acyl-CoA synthetase (AMP-forming)/AMP-acid ligase II